MINNLKKKIKFLNINNIQLYLFGLYFLSICIFEDNSSMIKYTEIVLLLFGILELISVIKTRKISFNLPIVFIVLFALFCILSSSWAFNYVLAIEKGKTMFLLSIFLLVSYNYFNRRDNGLEKLLKIIAIVGVLFSIFILMYYNPIDYVNRLFLGERIGFEIANVNSIGVMVTISFIICVFYAVFKSDKKYYFLSLFPLIVGIGSGSRKSILFVMISLFIMLIYFVFKANNKKKRNIIVFSICTLIVLMFLLYILKVPFITTQVDRLIGMVNGVLGIGEADHSTMLRVSYIKAGLNQFVKTPLFGVGIDNARLINVNLTYLHNNFVELLTSVGIIGFLLYYVTYFIVFYYFIKKRKQFNEYYLICLCIILNMFILDYGTVSYYSKTTYIYFLVGFLTLNVRNCGINLSFISDFINRAILKLMDLGFFNFMSDEKYIRWRYSLTFNKKLNLENPKTFNEKLQWLKLYNYNEKQTEMVDKYLAKKYVAKIIGKEYIIPTLGVYDTFDEIDFDKLPNSFVMKCTHDSGGLVIVKDKKTMNMAKAKKKINKSLKKNYYYLGREMPYKYVKPRIIIEKFMNNSNGELNDYKFFCFNGKIGYFLICSNRSTSVKFTFFDPNGKFLNVTQCGANNDPKVKMPEKLNEMKKLAEKLSQNMIHLRVDFYEINGKVYFGELTFFDSSGFGEFTPNKWDEKFGKLLVLPKQ